MNRFLTSLKDKKVRYGSFSTVMMMIAVAVFLMINLVADQFNVSKDMTPDSMYTLSRYSKEFLSKLDRDVTVYALFATGNEHVMMKQLLEEYSSASPHVRVEYRDPLMYPAFVEQYVSNDVSVSTNSVIVESGSKFRVVRYEDMRTEEFDWNTFQSYVTSIDIEPQISRAIHYVTLDESALIYNVVGSGERSLPENLVKQLDSANYRVAEADLTRDDVPEDCDMLFITIPERDWSSDKAERILRYLQNDGRAIFLLGYNPERFENIDNVLAAYGISVGDYYIVEGNADFYYAGNPLYLVPRFTDHEIVSSFGERRFFTLHLFPTGIDETEFKKVNTKIMPLVTTSVSAYGKVDPNSTTINKEPGDADGPFNLAVAIEDSFYTDKQYYTRFVVYGGGVSMLDESVNNATSGTNWDMLIKSADWLYGQTSGIYIPSKPVPTTTRLQMTQGEANTIALVSVVILPIVIIAAGLTVWLRRRHS